MCCNNSYTPKMRRSTLSEYLFAKFWVHAHRALEKSYGKTKDMMFAEVTGKILEIGPGTGINFRHYPKGVHVIGVEPNKFMRPYLEEEAANNALGLTVIEDFAERLDIEDNSIDAAVSTLVLCSVYETDKVLQEIFRVLKPGGKFYFIEHVAAQRGTLMRRVQTLLAPIWRKLGDGCNPDRETWVALENAGFTSLELEHKRVSNPFIIVSPHIMGVATK